MHRMDHKYLYFYHESWINIVLTFEQPDLLISPELDASSEREAVLLPSLDEQMRKSRALADSRLITVPLPRPPVQTKRNHLVLSPGMESQHKYTHVNPIPRLGLPVLYKANNDYSMVHTTIELNTRAWDSNWPHLYSCFPYQNIGKPRYEEDMKEHCDPTQVIQLCTH